MNATIDPWINIGPDYAVRYSTLRHDTVARNAHLGLARDAGFQVTCGCLRRGIPMGVGLRKQGNLFYLYPLHREDAGLHALGCPHRSHSDEAVGAQPVDGRTASSAAHHVECHADHTLLERLLHGARLTYWRPAFKSRNWAKARYHLVEAAKKIRIGDASLADTLFVPHPYAGPSREEAVRREWLDYLELLGPAGARESVGYVLGVVRAIDASPDGGAASVKLMGLHQGIYAPTSTPFLDMDPHCGARCLVLLRIHRLPVGKVRIVSSATAWMSTQFVPVYSPALGVVADDLVARQLSFSASILCDNKTAWAIPDFVVYRKEGAKSRWGVTGERPIEQLA